ncbi:Transcription factor [Pseudozyma hubeiensis]|nr:Transcription factor [Pseudozyma hubeiensis]
MSDNCVLIAANFLVPRTKEDLAMTTTMLRRMPCFYRLKRFSELDECKHAIEDDDQVWTSAVFEVPESRIGMMLQMLAGLPHFQTICLPEEREVLDGKLSLRCHPKLNGTSKGKEREVDAEDEGQEGTIDTEVTAKGEATTVSAPNGSGEASTSGSSNERGNGNKDTADETMATRSESEQAVKGSADIAIDDEPRIVRQRVLLPKARAALDEFVAQTLAGKWQLETSRAPAGLLYYEASLGGAWKEFTGRGGFPTSYTMPVSATFTPLSVIDDPVLREMDDDFYTNIFGEVRYVAPLDRERELYWRIELCDPFARAVQCDIYMFPAYDLEVGTPLEGLKTGDWLIAFNVQVPESATFASIKDASVVFVAVDTSQTPVYKLNEGFAAP